MKRYRNIIIEVVANGFIGTVGCQKVVAKNTDDVLELLKKYFDDPVKAEKELFDNHLSLNQPTPVESTRGSELSGGSHASQNPPDPENIIGGRR